MLALPSCFSVFIALALCFLTPRFLLSSSASLPQEKCVSIKLDDSQRVYLTGNGQKGAMGPIGFTGKMGPRGEKGERGYQGLTGLAGSKGVKGEKGNTSELVDIKRRIQQLETLVRSLKIGNSRNNPSPSCKRLNESGAPSGVYWLRPGSQTFQAYCDQTTEGGGWMLQYAYEHKRGENKPLVRAIPTDPNGYSHQHLQSLGVAIGWAKEVRFYCTTANHNRVLHFMTSNADVLRNAYEGGQHTQRVDWTSGSTKLGGHTAFLPDRTTGTSTSDGFVGKAPFYYRARYHWSIRSESSRFECDDWPYSEILGYNTVHRVFVRD